MHRLCLLLMLTLFAAPAVAAREWRQSREVEVLLSNLDIEPETIRLRAGEPVRLRFINNSTIPHSFNADKFFRKAEYRPRDAKAVRDGSIEIGPGNEREVLIVPAPGRYSAHCSNLFHRILGMRARILVE